MQSRLVQRPLHHTPAPGPPASIPASDTAPPAVRPARTPASSDSERGHDAAMSAEPAAAAPPPGTAPSVAIAVEQPTSDQDPPSVQARLVIGPVDDPYEREANAVANAASTSRASAARSTRAGRNARRPC